LVYSTKPLPADLEVTGTVELHLAFSTDVRDTDFFVTLADADPDGRANLITEGFLRARFRGSLSKPALLVPNKIYEVTIPLWETSNLFKANHRIQIQITSSNYPRFDRNLNSGKPMGTETEGDLRIARQTIYHDVRHPSFLVLPVIPPVSQ
jgi:putative CocE/NonD family hydrolase